MTLFEKFIDSDLFIILYGLAQLAGTVGIIYGFVLLFQYSIPLFALGLVGFCVVLPYGIVKLRSLKSRQ